MGLSVRGADIIDLEHEKRLTEVEQRSQSNTHRIDQLEKNAEDLHSLTTSVAVIAEKQISMSEKQDNMVDTVGGIQKTVSSLEAKPAKRWEAMVDDIIKLLVAAGVGFLLARLGL